MQPLKSVLVVSLLSSFCLAGSPRWHAVSYTGKALGVITIETVKVKAQQATLLTLSLPARHYFGYSGPKNLHTRNLRIWCRGVEYEVPQAFVDDLLDLRPGDLTQACVEGKDAAFKLSGSDGEKCYSVYFHFRKGRFFQRILLYSEVQTVYIRTVDDPPNRK